jgi:diaminohydroxyphosphoribosylaminopyrimidine deaminase/5-amino-6-(5-phosphoribosylamino)uracil reductase
VHTFVAPKLIGGHDAPTPLGDLGLYQMTDALSLSDVTLELVGPDLLISGYLPASGGLSAVSKAPAPVQAAAGKEVRFYKGWGEYGALSNFSPHSVRVASDAEQLEWSTVEVRRPARLCCTLAFDGPTTGVLPSAEVCRRGHP